MKNVLVIGAARSGIAAARLLKRAGYNVVLTDMKEIDREGLDGIEIFDKGHPECLKERTYEFIVKNPGIPYTAPLIQYFSERGDKIYTEIETASRIAKNFHYGAITGTDGKTTVTTLLWEMLKKKDPRAQAAGNIGIPLSDVVLEHENENLDVALELSNFQLLGTEAFHPEVCTVTNLAPDHLDYMDSLESYYASKMKIYANCTPQDWFIRNVDDEQIMKYATNIPCAVIDFSLKRDDVDLYTKDGAAWLNDIRLFDVADLKIVGAFNCGNAMMAACMAYKLGVSLEDIREVIRSFHGVEHRIEFVREIGGVRIYNDTKATNTHAACAALSAFDRHVILLCGGKDKHISFDDLKQFDDEVKHCFSFGQTKDHFKEIFTRQTSVGTMEEAFSRAMNIAVPGDVVLLSPACSSFDQFRNYEVRGEIFKEMVDRYGKD